MKDGGFLLFMQPREEFFPGKFLVCPDSLPPAVELKNLWLVSSTNSHPALSKSRKETKGLGRSIYFAFRGSKMVRASGNAPDRWHSSSATPFIKRTVRL